MVELNSPLCTALGPSPDGIGECTVEGTLYGYAPNLGANAFLAAFFGLCMLIHIILGIKYKTWTFMLALGLGCVGELVGYIGRIMLHNDPLSDVGFKIQICCLILAPSYVSAGIYLTLKHIIINCGEEWSRLRPALYTYIFITGDIISLVLQGAGGGISATADPGSSFQDVGTNLMIAGIVFQVVILSVFLIAVIEYSIRCYRHKNDITPASLELLRNTKFRIFCSAIAIAFLGIFVRCVYRIPELTGGWGNELMRNEPEFIVLEGVMIVIAVLVLTVCHPGIFFPAMYNTVGASKRRAKSFGDDSSNEMMDRA